MQYRILDDEGCGEYIGPRIGNKWWRLFAVLDEEYGRFISPNYPEPSPTWYSLCVWFWKSSPDVCGFPELPSLILKKKMGGTCHDYSASLAADSNVAQLNPQPWCSTSSKGATLLPIQFNSDFIKDVDQLSLYTDWLFQPLPSRMSKWPTRHWPNHQNVDMLSIMIVSHNDECEGEQISAALMDVKEKCVDPVSNSVRRKREVMAQELMIDVNIWVWYAL